MGNNNSKPLPSQQVEESPSFQDGEKSTIKQSGSSVYVDINLPIYMYPNVGFTCYVHYDFAPPKIHCIYGRVNDKNLCLQGQFLIGDRY